jgi:CRP-like cAMP-binding protein
MYDMTTKLTRLNSEEGKVSSAETPDMWIARVEYALNNLDDRLMLNRSPLARLPYVAKMAEEKYSSHILPRGLALRDILLTCVQKLSTELGNEPGLARACNYLQLLAQGLSCQEISKRLGLSREHVSRVYRKKAIKLATEEFLSIVNRK